MTNSINMIITHAKGIRFLKDLKKLNTTPDLREKLHNILDESFNKKYTRCPPHVYYCISTIIGLVCLFTSIYLLQFVGNVGFYVLPVGILGIVTPLFYLCIKNSNSSNLYYETMNRIDSETLGIHKITGNFNPGVWTNTITISTNAERLKRLKQDNAKPKVIPTPTPKNPPVPIQSDTQSFNDQRMTNATMFSGPFPQHMGGPQPMYGPVPMNPNQQYPGFSPFAQNSPFGHNVNMNQGGPGNGDLMIHEIEVPGRNTNTLNTNNLYQVPSDVVDDHEEKKK
jgi:hypothetical protein